jgi:hypothetical protein
MSAVISFPFRVLETGQVATSEEGSAQLYAEQLTVLVLTRPGERVGAPDFGITDPYGAELDNAELQAKMHVFGPPVTFTSLEQDLHPENVLQLALSFENDDFETFGRE